MKYIKLLAISFFVFFILFTLIGLLFPSSLNTMRAVVVNKPQTTVLQDLVISDNWIKWYPFFLGNSKTEVQLTATNVFVFNNGSQQLYINNLRTDSNSLSFLIKDWNGGQTEETIFALPVSDDSTSTQVVWKETEHLKWYPWERFRGLLLERTKGIYLDTALNRFKVYTEAIPQ
jgi:hypothetical protein